MVESYWILEFVKVLLAYAMVMFVWPCVVLQRYLKGKSLSFRFSFCVCFQILFLNTLVLMLGLFHLLNPWVVRILFWGIFLWGLFQNTKISKREVQMVRNLLVGNYGKKSFLVHGFEWVKSYLKNVWKKFLVLMKGHWWEYSILAVVLVFGIIYFSWGAFSNYSYGSGDMYPHSAWIYGLWEGIPFSDGVYPEAMHCFIYGIQVLFGIELYSVMLFLGGIHVVVFLLAAWIFMKEIFVWKYSGIFALVLFLTVDVKSVDMVSSISRLQWTIPQEFGLFSVFLCTAYLIKYLKYSKPALRKGKTTKGHWDENLLIFALSLAASLAIHFYVTIMAFFLCVAVVPFFLGKIFSRKHFLPLVAGVLIGVMIAVVPMAGALITGTPFQGSINWALSVMEGDKEEELDTEELETEDLDTQEEGSDSQTEDSAGGELVIGDSDGVESVTPDAPTKQPSKLSIFLSNAKETLGRSGNTLYEEGYSLLYGTERANWILIFTAVTGGFWLLYVLLSGAINLCFLRKKEKKLPWDLFQGQAAVTLATVICMAMYAAEAMGLPVLIAGIRLCSTEQMLLLAMVVMPLDWIFGLLALWVPKMIMNILSVIFVGVIYVGTMKLGIFHGYLYYELTRYNGAVMTTSSIIHSLPKESYTIISSSDEIYQVIYDGWHEELSTFLNSRAQKDYRIPTEYVFFYVEKKAIQRSQIHFFEGPDWLAVEKYATLPITNASEGDEIIAAEVTREEIDMPMITFSSGSGPYMNMDMRGLMQAQAMKWLEEFQEKYPYELQTYYEDENFVCYYFKQNPASLYQLGNPEGTYE